jgi:hypothetical protein
MNAIHETSGSRSGRRTGHALAVLGLLAAIVALYLRTVLATGAVGRVLALAAATLFLASIGAAWLWLAWRRWRRLGVGPLASRPVLLGSLCVGGGLLCAGYFGSQLWSVGRESFPSVASLWALLLSAAVLALAASTAWTLAVIAHQIGRSPLPAWWSRLVGGWWALSFTERALAVAVGAMVGWQWVLQENFFESGTLLRTLPPAAVMVAALAATARRRAELRPGAALLLAAAMYLGYFGVDVYDQGLSEYAADGPPGIGDHEFRALFPSYGRALLESGRLPSVEYPSGAVVAFAIASAVGPFPFAFSLMVLPLVLGSWWALARMRPDAPWLAAAVGVWPTIVPYWESKFDSLPTALMVFGLVAAVRRWWLSAGLLLGVAAAVKWYPGLAVPILAVGLVRGRNLASAARLVVGSIVGFSIFVLPFLGEIEALLAPYRSQGGRGVTGASFPFLQAHVLGLATPPSSAEMEAIVPPWLAAASVTAIAVALVGLAVLAWVRPERAVVLAAAAPVAFLVLNRIYSPQFIVPLAALLMLGAALQPFSVRRRLATVVLLATAATANFIVSPLGAGHWIFVQWVVFVATSAAALVAFSSGSGEKESPPDPSRAQPRRSSEGRQHPTPA